MSVPVPDFRDLMNGLDRLATQWGQEAARLQESLAAGATQVRRPEFAVTVNGGRITELEFTPAAVGASPVQLRERLLAAYREAAARSNQATAAAVSGVDADVAEGIRRSGPDAEDGLRTEASPPPAGAGADERPGAHESIEDWLSDPALDEAIVSPDIDQTMSDVEGWSDYRNLGDPTMWQYDLERTVAQLSSRAGELRERMATITAGAESPALALEVNAGGALVDVRLRPGASSLDAERLAAEFATLYAQATTEAGRQATEALRAGGASDGDPTLSVFEPLGTGADTSGADDPAAE